MTRRPIALADTANASALGAAMLGAVAAGARAAEATRRSWTRRAPWRAERGARIEPDAAAAAAYDALYRDWLELHDHFGRGGTDVMARLRRGRG